jgi:hypothetical protein
MVICAREKTNVDGKSEGKGNGVARIVSVLFR